MLVLSRKAMETVRIAGHSGKAGLTVKVLGIRGDKVKLGFDAPDHVEILRGELCEEADDEDAQERLQANV